MLIKILNGLLFTFAATSLQAAIVGTPLTVTTPRMGVTRAIAISNGVVIGGGSGYDSTDNGWHDEDGAAALFDADTGLETRLLVPQDPSGTSEFGHSVDIFNSRAIVGAPARSQGNIGPSVGVAYIFDVATGHQLYRLTASVVRDGARFGEAVAISDKWTLVGAPSHNSSEGAAFLFDVVTGVEKKQLQYSSRTTTRRDLGFGISTAIAGDRAVIGAGGHAFVYDLLSGNQVAELVPPTIVNNEIFGESVAITEKYIAVGATGPLGKDGAAYIYEAATGNLIHRIAPASSKNGDIFGYKVAISGDALLVSAPGRSLNGTALAGEVLLYDLRSGSFVDSLVRPASNTPYQLGWGVDFVGSDAVVVGSHGPTIFRSIAVPEPHSIAIAWLAVVTMSLLRRCN